MTKYIIHKFILMQLLPLFVLYPDLVVITEYKVILINNANKIKTGCAFLFYRMCIITAVQKLWFKGKLLY